MTKSVSALAALLAIGTTGCSIPHFGGVPSDVGARCIGISSGALLPGAQQSATVFRNAKFQDFVDGLEKQGYHHIAWSHENDDQYILRADKTDALTSQTATIAFEASLSIPAASSHDCSQGVVAIERYSQDNQDSGDVQALIMAAVTVLKAATGRSLDDLLPKQEASPDQNAASGDDAAASNASDALNQAAADAMNDINGATSEAEGTDNPSPSPVEAIQGVARPNPAHDATPTSLIGPWVPEGAYCASEDGTIYAADGTYSHGDREGHWKLSGNVLSMTSPAGNSVGIVTFDTSSQVSIAWKMWKTIRYRRCPGDGSYEPWQRP